MNAINKFFTIFEKIQEVIVLFAVACLTIHYFGGYYLIITTIGDHSRLLAEIAITLLFFKIVTTRYSVREFLCVVLLLLLAVTNYRYSGNTRAIYNVLMLCSLKNVDLKKVFRVSFVSIVFIIGLLAALALSGVTGTVSITEDFGRGVGEAKIETRYTMGFIHPNTWAQAVFSAMLLGVLAFWEKVDWKGILLLAVINYGVYRLAISRASFLCGIALIVLVFLAKYAKRFYEFWIIRIGIIGGITAIWAIILTSKVNIVENLEWLNLDKKIFTGRLMMAKYYFDTMGWSYFGEKVPSHMVENGWVLDMGYMRMLLENGVIIFGLMFAATIALLIYAFIHKRNDIIVTVLCICLYGIYENKAISQVPANLMIYYMALLMYHKKKVKKKKKSKSKTHTCIEEQVVLE